MSELRADSPALGLAGPTQAVPGQGSPGNGWPAKPKPSGLGWPLSRWLMFIALVCAAHVVLLYMFGARKQMVPRTATDAPTLRLANGSDELLALNDPTLFALPHSRDFVMATWSQAPVTNPPSFHLSEAPRWLPLSADGLMTVFNRFMQTNRVAGFELQLKPPVRLSTPVQPIEPALPQVSTNRVEGDLAQRRLLTPMDLPSLPYADVLPPSTVQVLVDAAGNVVSAVLLLPDNALEIAGRPAIGDTNALAIARALRFAPAPRLTLGRMIFTWHTVPPPAINIPTTADEPTP
jgi:hypothetical protein